MNKELLTLLLQELLKEKEELQPSDSNWIGRYVLIRTYSAGVHIGKLYEKKGNEVILHDSRRIWRWEGACSLSQLAKEGTKKPCECKFAISVEEIHLLNVIEIIPLTTNAKQNLYGTSEWKS